MDYEIKSDLKRLDSLTDEDIRRAIAEDPDAAPELDEAMICLLYTSPSPRDRTRSRMPSSA